MVAPESCSSRRQLTVQTGWRRRHRSFVMRSLRSAGAHTQRCNRTSTPTPRIFKTPYPLLHRADEVWELHRPICRQRFWPLPKCTFQNRDLARTRTWNPLIRSQMPYPLGHETPLAWWINKIKISIMWQPSPTKHDTALLSNISYCGSEGDLLKSRVLWWSSDSSSRPFYSPY